MKLKLNLKLKRTHKFLISIFLYLALFLAEVIVGYKTESRALQADAYHVLSDCLAFIVALWAELLASKKGPNKKFSFGYQKAKSLGAFFNGVWLVCLGIQFIGVAIERFIRPEHVEGGVEEERRLAKMALITACVGLAFNFFSLVFLHRLLHDHEHGHGDHQLHALAIKDPANIETTNLHPVVSGRSSHTFVSTDVESQKSCRCKLRKKRPASSQQHHHHGHEHNIVGVLLHIMGDILNNVAVIIASAVMWKSSSESAKYADPIATLVIALILIAGSIRLIRQSAQLLLLPHPIGLDMDVLRTQLSSITGVIDVHELHVFSLTQFKNVASAHVTIACGPYEAEEAAWSAVSKEVGRAFHQHGVHSWTVQPEYVDRSSAGDISDGGGTVNGGVVGGGGGATSSGCQLVCEGECRELRCCCD